MKIKEYKKLANLIRDTEVYKVFDYHKLQNLCLSLTELHAGQHTAGHSHYDADEITFFVSGNGVMEIGNFAFPCTKGDVFLIPRGEFHRVFNVSNKELVFWNVFEKYGERK